MRFSKWLPKYDACGYCPTEIWYRLKESAETIGIGIGFGAEFFFSETETFFFVYFCLLGEYKFLKT